MTETAHQSPEQTLPKTFDPAAIEAHWYAHWEDNGLFRPERPDAAPFTFWTKGDSANLFEGTERTPVLVDCKLR